MNGRRLRLCYLSVGAFGHVGPYLEHFKEAGHDVSFVALSPSPPRPVPTYELGLGGVYDGVRGKWKYPLSMARARALIRRLRPDIVHAHYATSGGLAGLLCGHHPTVVTAHGTDLTQGSRSPVWRPLLKAVFARADCVNTVSEDLKRMALGLGVDERKIEVLTLGIETQRFMTGERRKAPRGKALKLVCTRRMEKELDCETVVEALALLKKRGVAFQATLAGDGSLREPLERLARGRGLGPECVFAGAVSQADMPALLRAHDVYLSASRWDGTSLSLLEALAAGLFPVVSRITANEAWLEHGVSGLLHAPGDPEHLARLLEEAAARPELASRAFDLNRRKVVELGDRTTNMRRLEAIYRRLLT